MDAKDYYKIMGLSREATAKDIKAAYRRLARKYHPDLNKEANAEENFKTLGEAYEVLKDPEKRKVYDNYVNDAEQNRQGRGYSAQTHANGQGADPFAGFEGSPDFFEFLFGQHRQAQQPVKGVDLRSNITVTLEEAYQGSVKELQIQTSSSAPKSVLRVKIPVGVKEGQQIRLPGQGGVSASSNKRGDLYLTIHIAKHPLFDVKGNDIYVTLPVTPWEVALGTTIQVPTLAGIVDLKVAAGSQGGQTLRLKSRGLPDTVPGDQYVLLKIVTPKPTTDAARALYKTMADEMPFNPRAQMGG